MRGDIPPLPEHAFMAWCSIKAQGEIYLLLSLNTQQVVRLKWKLCILMGSVLCVMYLCSVR